MTPPDAEVVVPGSVLEVALQMWTVREQMRVDAIDCLAQVAATGYGAVELVGYGNAGFEAVRDRLVEVDVLAISQHVPYRRFAEELDAVLDENAALGCSYVVLQQGRHEDWVDVDAVRRFADTANAWGEAARAGGLALGYHGYHELELEFAPLSVGTRWDLFAELVDPELVFLQLDTYWVRRTGNDPALMLERFAGRVPMLHLKDTLADAEGAEAWRAGSAITDTTIGDGLMDLQAILEQAARGGTRWVIVEQEGDPVNALRDIRRSRQNLAEALQRMR